MLKYIDYAYEIYREKSFTKAAKKLFITQPSLSLNIKKLEDELGFPVFDRNGKEVRLTPMGERYISYVEQIMKLKSNFENELDDFLKLKKGNVTIGSTTFIASYIMPEILKKFSKTYPEISVNLFVESSTILYEKLENGFYDMVIDNAMFKNSSCKYLPVLKEKIIVAVPAESEVNKKLAGAEIDKSLNSLKKINLKELENEKFVLLKRGNKMRDIASKIFDEADISPEVIWEFDHLMTAVNYAEHGFGATFLTDTVLKYGKPLENLRFYLPKTQHSERTLYIIYNKRHYLTTAAKKLIEFMPEAL